jgi:hypothetical protein
MSEARKSSGPKGARLQAGIGFFTAERRFTPAKAAI